MSDNNLVNIKKMSDEQIMQVIGQDDGSNLGINIPRLAINRTPEDDDGNQLPVGHFYTYDSSTGQNVYSKPVTFRPFISAMQYMHYDAVKSEYVNRSIIFKSWREEAIDILGGTKCGKIPFKERSSLTPEQLEEQRTIRCYKLVYGLLSFDKGVNSKGETTSIKDLPVLYRVTGTAFSPVSSALDLLNKRKKLMELTPCPQSNCIPFFNFKQFLSLSFGKLVSETVRHTHMCTVLLCTVCSVCTVCTVCTVKRHACTVCFEMGNTTLCHACCLRNIIL